MSKELLVMGLKTFYPGSRKLILVVLLFCTPAFLGLSCRTALHGPETSPFLPVTRVVDGDTFWADDGTPGGIKVRLIGVDAPETRKTGHKEAGYFGPESKDCLRQMITGKKVRLEYDVAKYDQYYRTLAYVFLEDGTFVNAELIRGGYAMVLTVPPNVKYADDFLKLQRKARRQDRGLWGGREK